MPASWWFEGRSVVEDAGEGDFEAGLEEEGEVGEGGEAVDATDPFLGATSDDIAGEGGEDEAVAEDDVTGLEEGNELAFVAVGEVGGVDEAEGGGGEEILFLALAGGGFDQGGGVPLAEEDLEALQFEPAFEEIDLGRLAGAVEAFDGDEAAGITLFGEGELHGGQTWVNGRRVTTRFLASTPRGFPPPAVQCSWWTSRPP